MSPESAWIRANEQQPKLPLTSRNDREPASPSVRRAAWGIAAIATGLSVFFLARGCAADAPQPSDTTPVSYNSGEMVKPGQSGYEATDGAVQFDYKTIDGTKLSIACSGLPNGDAVHDAQLTPYVVQRGETFSGLIAGSGYGTLDGQSTANFKAVVALVGRDNGITVADSVEAGNPVFLPGSCGQLNLNQ